SERAEAVAAHLGICPACAEEFRCLREVVRWTGMIPEEEPPAYLRASILHAMANLGPTPIERFWSAIRQAASARSLIWATCAAGTAALPGAPAGTRGPPPALTRLEITEITSRPATTPSRTANAASIPATTPPAVPSASPPGAASATPAIPRAAV